MMEKEALIPRIGVVTDIRRDTPDVKTFRVVGTDGNKLFTHIPGQCAMLSIPGVGEAMFSITSSPTLEEYMEFSIKKCGCLTAWLHQMEVGQEVLVRGPYGNGFPVEGAFRGKDLLFIAGGIRSMDDLVDLEEIKRDWIGAPDMDVYLTIDREQEGWDGHVGFVPTYVQELGFSTDKTAVLCGPPIMIHFTLEGLKKLGFADNQVFTTLEMRMKCGIGKCGRCNVGDKFVCKDGPVFSFDQLGELPDEY